MSWSVSLQDRRNVGETDAQPSILEAAIWQLISDNITVERPRAPLAIETVAGVNQSNSSFLLGNMSSGLSVSPDGKRLVWVGADGQLRTAEAGSEQGTVVDDLRPISRQVYAQLSAE